MKKTGQIFLILMTAATICAAELDFSVEVKRNQQKFGGESTTVVLYNVAGGEIAMSSPNAEEIKFNLGILMRPLIVDEAIRGKTVKWDSVIDCGNKVFVHDGRTVRSNVALGKLPVSKVLSQNSSIGCCKIGLSVGESALNARLEQLGIPVGRDSFDNLMGWGNFVTPIQTVRLFHSLAAETQGKLANPYLVTTVMDKNIEHQRYYSYAIGFVNYLGRKYLLFFGVANHRPDCKAEEVARPLWNIIAAELERQKEQ